MNPDPTPEEKAMEKTMEPFPKEKPQWPIRAALIFLVSAIGAVIAWFFHAAPPLPK